MPQRKSISRLWPVACAALAAVLLHASPASAYWPANGRLLLSHSTAQLPAPVSDGAAGAFVAYVDKQGGATVNGVYLQHVLANGELDPSWPARGKRISSSTAGQQGAAIYPDGLGTWTVVWQDSINVGYPRVKLLRVTSSGVAYSGWPSDGVLATAGRVDIALSGMTLVPDNQGGVFVLWTQQDSTAHGPSDRNIWGSHISSTGALASGWPAAGKALTSAAKDQKTPRGVPDGSGGAVLLWNDLRTFVTGGQTYAMRIDATGARISPWPANGTPVVSDSTVPGQLINVLSDGSGGVIASWNVGTTLHAMRLASDSARLWSPGAGGYVFCSNTGQPTTPLMCSDGAHGALLGWSDDRAGFLSTAPDVFSQRLDASAATHFAADGASITSAPGLQNLTGLVSSAPNGAIYVWTDIQVGQSTTQNIIAQRLDGSGNVQWPAGGVTVCSSGAAGYALATSDGAQGTLVAWMDTRSAPDTGLYIAKVTVGGLTGPTAVTLSSLTAGPAPAGVELTWSAFLSGSATFRVERSARREGPFEPVGALIPATAEAHEYSFRDSDVDPGGVYYYQVGWNEGAGWKHTSPVTARAGAAAFALRRIGPNPARGEMNIEFESARAGAARIEICDLSGRRVRSLLSSTVRAGLASVRWNGHGDDQQILPSGAYFVRLTVGTQRATQKVVWLR